MIKEKNVKQCKSGQLSTDTRIMDLGKELTAINTAFEPVKFYLHLKYLSFYPQISIALTLSKVASFSSRKIQLQ